MRRFRFELALGGALLALFASVWLWQTGRLRGALTPDEIDAQLAAIARNLPDQPENRDLLERLRAWCEADDGRPFAMLNLMRFHEELRPDVALAGFEGGPREANAHYEAEVTPLVLAAGGHPLFMGEVPGPNLIGGETKLDGWSRVLLVRYPSRRHFLGLLADPAYGPLEPYKMAALEVVLVPVDADLSLPELRWIVGPVFAVLFFAIAWLRSFRPAS